MYCSESSITPNLSGDKISLNLNRDLLLEKEIFIFNSIGQLVEKRVAAADKLEIVVSNYADGYYYISIPCEEREVLAFVVAKY